MLELFLIVAVWKRGWGPLALLPTFLTGIAAFSVGATASKANFRVLCFSGGGYRLLGIMLCNPREASKTSADVPEGSKPLEQGVPVAVVEPSSQTS